MGAWDPRGRFLLVGVKTLSLTVRQAVVDRNGERVLEMATFGEGDYGERAVWVKTDVLGAIG